MAFDYTPKTIHDIVYPDDVTQKLVADLVTGNRAFPAYGKNSIVLFGTYGTGKTTLAKMLPDAIELARGGAPGGHRYEKIGPNNNGVPLYTSLQTTADLVPLGLFRTMVLDEADLLTSTCMDSLKGLMDNPNTLWVLCTNNLGAINPAVKNRSHVIEFNAAPADRWMPLARRIMRDFGVPNIDYTALTPVIDAHNGSARGIVNDLIEFAQQRRVHLGLPRL